MDPPTATLEEEPIGAMNEPAPQPEPSKAERKSAMKFTYASGSTPLDGYTIKRGVGCGGFGEVYYGISDAGKEVAMKLIRRNLDIELRGVRHCLNLKHPNLVALYDIKADTTDDHWVIMEYVAGESLEDAIDRNPNGMPVDDALRWMHGICAGVAYLHDHGIVHRDLKPGNIFCDEGLVKIGDYGLSKFISCSRRSGQTESVGTVHYMAPEISNGRYGQEIDTYALGVILYEMLTGHVPFEGESIGEVLMKHLTAEPDLSALSEPFLTIVQKALTKDPENRLKSVAQMAEMLPYPEDGQSYVCQPPNLRPVNKTVQPAGFTAKNAASNRANGVRPTQEASAPRGVKIARGLPNEKAIVVDAEEPILAAIRQGWQNAETAWHESKQPVAKVAILIFGIIAAVATAELWMPALFFLSIFYCFYWCFRRYIIRPKEVRYVIDPQIYPPIEPDAFDGIAEPNSKKKKQKDAFSEENYPNNFQGLNSSNRSEIHAQQAVAKHRKHRRRHYKNAKQQLNELVANKTFRVRATELLGSMLISGIVAAVASLVAIVLFSSVDGDGSGLAEQGLRTYAWLTCVGTLGAWLVMIPSKFTEGKLEDQTPKRFINLIAGLLLGLIAYGLANALAIHLPYIHDMTELDTVFGSPHNRSIAASHLANYVGYFACLLVAVKWWRQAEWTRLSRLSIWSVALSVFFAWFLHIIWWFPQPSGMMVAGIMAVTIQLSSTWLPLSKRKFRPLPVQK